MEVGDLHYCTYTNSLLVAPIGDQVGSTCSRARGGSSSSSWFCCCNGSDGLNPFRTAVPFWGQSSQISSSFVPKRDSGSKGVNGHTTRILFIKLEDNSGEIEDLINVESCIFTYTWYAGRFKKKELYAYMW